MEILSIIKQLTEQLSESTTEQERISHLGPIEIVLLNLTKDVKIKVNEKHTFLCDALHFLMHHYRYQSIPVEGRVTHF